MRQTHAAEQEALRKEYEIVIEKVRNEYTMLN